VFHVALARDPTCASRADRPALVPVAERVGGGHKAAVRYDGALIRWRDFEVEDNVLAGEGVDIAELNQLACRQSKTRGEHGSAFSASSSAQPVTKRE